MDSAAIGSFYGEKAGEIREVLSLLDAKGIVDSKAPLEGHYVGRLLSSHLAALSADGSRVRTIHTVAIYNGSWERLHEGWSAGAAWRESVAARVKELVGAQEVAARRALPAPPIWPVDAINVFGVVVVATEESWKLCTQKTSNPEMRRVLWEILCFAEGIVDDLLVAVLLSDDALRRLVEPLVRLMRVGVVPLGWGRESFECFRFCDEEYEVRDVERVSFVDT